MVLSDVLLWTDQRRLLDRASWRGPTIPPEEGLDVRFKSNGYDVQHHPGELPYPTRKMAKVMLYGLPTC